VKEQLAGYSYIAHETTHLLIHLFLLNTKEVDQQVCDLFIQQEEMNQQVCVFSGLHRSTGLVVDRNWLLAFCLLTFNFVIMN
jgi:hypothetical protein